MHALVAFGTQHVAVVTRPERRDLLTIRSHVERQACDRRGFELTAGRVNGDDVHGNFP
jgi:hypothetical protein